MLSRFGYALVLLVIALIGWSLQPWRFHYAGYARSDVSVAGGNLRFDLVDHAGRQPRAHCLSYSFKASEAGGEPITIALTRVGTPHRSLRENVRAAGNTDGIPPEVATGSFFHAPNVGGLPISFDEPLELEGTVHYQGGRYPFRTRLQLRRWHKDLDVTSFCVG